MDEDFRGKLSEKLKENKLFWKRERGSGCIRMKSEDDVPVNDKREMKGM